MGGKTRDINKCMAFLKLNIIYLYDLDSLYYMIILDIKVCISTI